MQVTLTTERLLLRVPNADDLDDWAAFGADAAATRFLGGPSSRAIAWRHLTVIAGSWALFGYGMFSVIERASGRWIGRVGPWQPEGWPGPEVGWGLLSDAWGRGYATEAATAAMDFAFDELGWACVVHAIEPANAASVRVAERLGSAHLGTGTLPDPIGITIDLWGQTREQWQARRDRPPAT